MMDNSNKKNTVFVMASTGYNKPLVESHGYKVYSPYKGSGLLSRIVREIWFTIPLLNNKFWFDKSIVSSQPNYIIIYDSLITKEYLIWIHELFPNAQINYCYNNMVGKARHLFPRDIPEFVRVWTYDEYDSRKYKLNLYPYCITRKSYPQKKHSKYDVFFVGKDKGRGEWLCAFEKRLCSMGLKTKFIITKNGRLSKKKPYYQKEIPYNEVLNYNSRSKSILNIVMSNQEGVTMRDIEATSMSIKLITNNKHIKNKDFYNPSNIFILGERDETEIVDFLSSEFENIPNRIFDIHTFKNRIDTITSQSIVINEREIR